MKKLFTIMLVAAMTVGVFGTAMAVDYVRVLPAGVTYYASPVGSGDTVYVLGSTGNVGVGATLFQVNPATGNSAFFNGAYNDKLGTYAFSSPILYNPAGDSGVTVVMNVAQDGGTPVAGEMDVLVGTSLWAVYFSPGNKTGVTSWGGGTALDFRSGITPAVVGWPDWQGGSTAFGTHLMVDMDSTTGGSSVYGTSGSLGPNGVSFWAISLGDTPKNGALNSNQWSSRASGVSSVLASPLISGNSFFVLGNYELGANSGTSLMVFDKRKLNAGPNKVVNVLGTNGLSNTTPFATPAITGNSLFVVDSRGGLTAYSIAPGAGLLTAGANDFVQLGPITSSVTASPVCDSYFLVVAVNHANGAAGITCFQIDTRKIAGPSGVSWWYEWPTTGTTITATPAISNGSVYVPVNYAGNGSRMYRFTMNKGAAGRITTVDQEWTVDARNQSFGFVEASSPIILSNRLIFVSDVAKKIYSLDVGDYTYSESYWTQFKFGPTRTGENTAVRQGQPAPGSSGGCFISTVK